MVSIVIKTLYDVIVLNWLDRRRRGLKMKLVLLPGMDGTGLLFDPFLRELPQEIKPEIISYSSAEKQTYSDLVDEVRTKLPNEPFILMAESFSGYIAFRLSLEASIPINKIILVASFLSSPYPVLGFFIRHLPLRFLFSFVPPKFIIHLFCFGQNNNDLLTLFRESISKVSADVLAFRLRQIFNLAQPKEQSSIQCLIINASNDRLIQKSVSSKIESCFSNTKIEEVEGTHFLAQTNPRKLANLLSAFIDQEIQLCKPTI